MKEETFHCAADGIVDQARASVNPRGICSPLGYGLLCQIRNDKIPSLVGDVGAAGFGAARGAMARKTLAGRLILIAEDEALISMDIENTFEGAGARVRVCRTVEDALVVAEDADLAAAVVNHVLHDGESSPLCGRLTERDIPFVLFSGFTNVEGACRTGVQVHKPTTSSILLTTVAGLLRPHLTLVPKQRISL